MSNKNIQDELAKSPRLEGESKTEWVFRAFHSWCDDAVAMRYTYSTAAWTMVVATLLEYSPVYLSNRTGNAFFFTIGDADWLRMIRAHGDEVVAEADDMMPRGFKKTTRDDIRWILNTLGRHMAES